MSPPGRLRDRPSKARVERLCRSCRPRRLRSGTPPARDARLYSDSGTTLKLNIIPALVVLGDVTVRHPEPGVGDVEQDVDRLAGPHENRVLPGEVGLDDSVPSEDEEAARAMHVEGMRHRVV